MITLRNLFKNLYKLCPCGYCTDLIPIFNSKGKPTKFKKNHGNRGVNSPQWKGGMESNNDKYIMIKKRGHGNADKRGRVYLHIYVMSEHLGRPLKKGEVVHHIDGDPTNNELNNLQLLSGNAEHRKKHRIDMSNRRCSSCGKTRTNGRHWFDDFNGGYECRNCHRRRKYKEKKG